MGRARVLSTNFSAGQMDPRMKGRSDTSVYENGAETLTNSSPLVQGGVRRRPGTVYLATLPASSRIEHLQFSETQLYIFAFYNAGLKIYDETGALAQTFTSQPWDATTMWDMRLAQSGDTTIIFHEDWMMQNLKRTGATTFTMTDFAFETHSTGYPIYEPYYKFSESTLTLTPSATTGSITLTTSGDHWTADHVGSTVRYIGKTCTVTGYTSATVVDADVNETLASTTADTDWDENIISAANGYGRSGTFHGRRLWIGGTRDLPAHILSSGTGAYFNFNVGTALADESVQAPLGEDRVNVIKHLVSSRHLQIFTDQGSLYVPQGSSENITPAAFSTRFQVPYGAGSASPQRLDGGTLFVQDTDKVVRELLWDDLQQGYTANAVSFISNDMIVGVTDMAVLYGHASGPEQFAAIVNSNGNLAVYHSIRNEKISGWFPWETSGNFQSVTGLNNVMYCSVERTVNSATVYYLEKFDFDVTVDAAATLSAVSGTTWGGLTHLEAESVFVVDGNLSHNAFTVDGSGEVTIIETATAPVAGLDYARTIKTLAPSVANQAGEASGEMKRVGRVVLEVFESVNFAVNGHNFIIRQVDDDMSEDPTPVSGRHEFSLLGWDRYGQITITQDAPLPFTLLSIWKEVWV